MKNADVVVAGAGPAGCTFALTLTEDVSVTVLEKGSIDELGHDWIDGVDLKIVKNYDFVKYIEKIADSASASFYSPNGAVKINAPLTERIDIDRKVLAKNLIRALESKANVQIIERAQVIEPLVEDNVVVGVKYLQDAQEYKHESRLVVDATGYSAILRKKLPSNFQFRKELEKGDTFLTFRKYIKRPDEMKKKEFKVIFGKYRGLSWINTELDDMIDFLAGVTDLPDHKNPKEILQELEDSLSAEFGGQIDMKPVRANYTGFIPVRRCLDSFCADNLLLIGDTACQVEPIPGCGIASGMLAGYLAATTVNSLLDSGKEFTKANLWPYNHEWIKQVGARYVSIDVIRLFLMSLTESDFNFLLKKRIITERDLAKSLSGEKLKLSLLELLQKVWRGITRLGLLLKLNTAINDADKLKNHYLAYPEEFNEQAFLSWQRKKDRIIKKYYRKLKTKNKGK